MTRITAELAVLACAAWGQSAAPRFEAASVKAKTEVGRRVESIGPLPGGERYRAGAATLKSLVAAAWHVMPELVSGGPAWIDREFYQVDAKAERPSSAGEMRAMLRNLLMDRFALKVRREEKEMPVYALLVDAGGPTMARAAERPDGGDPAVDQSVGELHRMKWKARTWPMAFLAWRLGFFAGRPVIDYTGLDGEYDFELNFVDDVPAEVAERLGKLGFDPHPTMFEALRRQLGLRLEARKGPVETIIVVHAGRPGPN